MNIIYIVNQVRKAGPVEVLYSLLKNLDKSSFVPIIVRLMEDDIDRSITSKFEELGIEVFKLSYSFWDLELRTTQVAKRVTALLKGDALYLPGRFCEF